MPRYFNTTGPCMPHMHYMLPPADRLIGASLDRYIRDQLYWVLHGCGGLQAELPDLSHVQAAGLPLLEHAVPHRASHVRGRSLLSSARIAQSHRT